MFTDIEREYQAGLTERRFWNYYACRAIPTLIIAMGLAILFKLDIWLLTTVAILLLLAFVVWFFVIDFHTLVRQKPKRHWLKTYIEADNKARIDNLVADLRDHHLMTKDDLKLTIDYFTSKRPITTKTSLLEWVLSIIITMMSVVAIAYDDQARAVDTFKLTAIFWPTLRIALIIVVPILLIGFIANRVLFSRAKIDLILIEDLSYIYVNFDKFHAKLSD